MNKDLSVLLGANIRKIIAGQSYTSARGGGDELEHSQWHFQNWC